MNDGDAVTTTTTTTTTKATTTTSPKRGKQDVFFTTPEYDDAIDELEINNQNSIDTLLSIIKTPAKNEGEKVQKARMKEEAIYVLVKQYINKVDYASIQALFVTIRPFFDEVSKPRSAKIIRTIIDMVIDCGKIDYAQLVVLIQEAIQWATEEKRAFVRQRLQAKLAQVLALSLQYREAILTIRKLMKEIKKIDDKPLIVDLQLVESEMYFKLKNYPKSRGALTLARATATGFYCPPATTAQIEMRAGMLSCREKDYPTAESYFHEAVDNFLVVNRVDDAIVAFKYMLFCKILNNQAGEVVATINQRTGNETAGAAATTSSKSNIAINNDTANRILTNKHIISMEQLSIVYQTKQYHALDRLFNKYPEELLQDTLINDQLETLRDNLLENSIKKIIASYTRMDIKYLSQLLDLSVDVVESKLSQLILDDKISAQLDHNFGDLIILEKFQPDALFKQCEETLGEMNVVVDKLTARMDKVVNTVVDASKEVEEDDKKKEDKKTTPEDDNNAMADKE